MAQQAMPPDSNSTIGLLLKALLTILQKLSDPIPLFVLAICIIALLAAAIGGQGLIVELRVFLAFLAVVGIAGIVASQFLRLKRLKSPGGASMSLHASKMNAGKKRLDLLRQCLDRLNEDEFQELMISLLSPSERTRLTQPHARATFLGDLEQWGNSYLDRLEGKLRDREEWCKRLSDLLEQLEGLATAAETAQQPERLQGAVKEQREGHVISVDFVNRVDELDSIFRSTQLAQYWIIDAPAGYGKSRFLQEIQRHYETKGWACCYVEIPRDTPLKTRALVGEIARELGFSGNYRGRMEARRIGRQIAASLLDLLVEVEAKDGIKEKIHLFEAKYSGVSIALDNVEVLDDQTLSELAALIPGIYDGLIGGGFFSGQNRLRFFLAGRGARGRALATLNKGGAVMTERTLSAYSFDVVETTVGQYALKKQVTPPETNLGETAACLMDLTGGHPGCMATILEELAQSKFAHAPFVLKEDVDRFLSQVVFPVLEDLENVSDRSELVSILETLSVFRRYGAWLLQALISEKHIQWDGDGYQLEGVLIETYLVERRKGFLQDDITRRLFALRLRHRNPDRFRELCQAGPIIYENYLKSSDRPRYPEIVAVEWLYQKLQYEYYVEGKRGTSLMQEILRSVAHASDILVATWDYREIIPDFIDALNEDWELEFTVNHLLSEEGYSREPYRQLLQRVEEERHQQEKKAQRLLRGEESNE
jgi:hypothetical protein